MTNLFGLGHVAQLYEIQKARLKRGELGLGPEVEELIARLTSGGVAGKSDDPRVIHAKRLFDLGWGRELGIDRFEDYLETIPTIPESLIADDPNFPLLGLDDPRVGLSRSCEMAGVKFKENGHKDKDAIPFDKRHSDPKEPYWFRAHDGRKNCNRKHTDCRDEAKDPIFAMTARVGLMTFVRHPSIIAEGEHILLLPDTGHRMWPSSCAYLQVLDGQPQLWLYSSWTHVGTRYGSGDFRRE